MIRIRRIRPRGVFGRRLYEIEFPSPDDGNPPIREVSRTPVTRIDPVIGVGDAWTLVRAADDAWDGDNGDWVTLESGT